MHGKMSFRELHELIRKTDTGSGQFVDSNGISVTKKFNYREPATTGSFEILSSQLFWVPHGLYQLLEISDGFEIYNYEGVDGYKIFSTSEIPAINRAISDSYDDQWDDRFLVFAECIGDGTYLALKNSHESEEIVDCFLDVNPSEWKAVSPNISEFFAQLIESNGQKFWLANPPD